MIVSQFRPMLKGLWSSFVDGLIDNDEKIASPKKKNIQYRRCDFKKGYLILDGNGQNRYLFSGQNG